MLALKTPGFQLMNEARILQVCSNPVGVRNQPLALLA